MQKMKKKSSYAGAGVDIDEMMGALSAVKRMVRKTTDKRVLSGVGAFGGLFTSPGKDKALVASTDGVGTKLKVAVMTGRHDTVGRDLVNHCVNDILVQGATPMFFMDYIGTGKLSSGVFREIVRGLCVGCRHNKCALLGGETAEMPGLYPAGEYDLVGTIVGSVDRAGIVNGASIEPGNMIIGLASTGLHTNGYSLARKVIFEKAGLKLDDVFPGTAKSVAQVLMAVHKSYLKPVTKVMAKIDVLGMAHITGGGLMDNVPRVLPRNTSAVIDRSSWRVPPVFDFIQEQGGVDRDEMFRVFNMGIGYVMVVREDDVDNTISILKEARCRPALIGYVGSGRRVVRLTG